MENSLQVLRLREHSTPLSLSFGDQVSVATSGSSHSSYDDIIPDESNDFILFTDNTNSEYEDYEDSWESSVIQVCSFSLDFLHIKTIHH